MPQVVVQDGHIKYESDSGEKFVDIKYHEITKSLDDMEFIDGSGRVVARLLDRGDMAFIKLTNDAAELTVRIPADVVQRVKRMV